MSIISSWVSSIKNRRFWEEKEKALSVYNCKSLHLDKSGLKKINDLSMNMLTHILIQQNLLTELCELPSTLIYLNCSHNMLTRLPNLPSSLVKLECGNNCINILPELNDNLKYLCCENNELVEFPYFTEDSSLIFINCRYNNIREITAMPNLLQMLIGDCNKLEFICDFPISITEISISYNNLTRLPPLSKLSNLTELYCSHNLLAELPSPFPNSLLILGSSHNKLTYLPNLKNISSVKCEANNLGYYPREKRSGIILSYHLNPIYTVVFSMYQDRFYKNIEIIHKFRFLYYGLKFKNKLRTLLWDKILRPRIEAKYRPDNLTLILTSDDDENEEHFHNVLSNW
jgi:Leucine-rich repeat (LRR) protein